MNILYILGALIMLIILGFAYFLFTRATKERGAIRITGQVLSVLLVVVLVLMIVLYKTGAVGMPTFMPERPSTRIMTGMSGYVAGMMIEDPKAIDEFINILKTNPELYEKFKEKLK